MFFYVEGGETKALQRVKYYLWESKLLSNYFNIRNGMLGGDYSTKLSVWLAHGCISPNYIWDEIRSYEKQKGNNKSTYWCVLWVLMLRFYDVIFCEHPFLFHFAGWSLN
jgi:deoxyribodipyrimidine photo-lyase